MTSERVWEGGACPVQRETEREGQETQGPEVCGATPQGGRDGSRLTGMDRGDALKDGKGWNTGKEQQVQEAGGRHVGEGQTGKLTVSAEGLENGCLQQGGAGREGDVKYKKAVWGEEAGGSDPREAECSRAELLQLAAVLSDTSGPVQPDDAQPMPLGWHFPAGPGLSQMTYCPSQPFPVPSYYPAPQQMAPFEVVWRLWENLSHPQDVSVEQQALFEFTTMSYNVLAQDLLEANSELYSYCSPNVLAWDFRFQSILRELQTWKPDIVCLQEVQADHYVQDFLPALTEMGYDCVYKRRTRAKKDGCVVCYQKSRFSQASVRLVEYFRPQMELLDWDNVAVVVLLQPVSKPGSEVEMQSSPICVANTHLVFNPRRGEVKLAQLALLLAEINRMVKPWRLTGSPCPIILCGDFNALPNTPLYQFITSGQLYYHGLPAWMVSGQEDLSHRMHYRTLSAPLWPETLGISDNCQYTGGSSSESKAKGTQSERTQYSHDFLLRLRFSKAALIRPRDLLSIPGVTDIVPDPLRERANVPRFSNLLQHGLNLRSAYNHYERYTGQPEVTTLHSDFGATVDYIFYTPSSAHHGRIRGHRPQQDGCLKLIGRLALPSEETLWPMNGLPNESFPSDHLSLLAKFQLSPGST